MKSKNCRYARYPGKRQKRPKSNKFCLRRHHTHTHTAYAKNHIWQLDPANRQKGNRHTHTLICSIEKERRRRKRMTPVKREGKVPFKSGHRLHLQRNIFVHFMLMSEMPSRMRLKLTYVVDLNRKCIFGILSIKWVLMIFLLLIIKNLIIELKSA